VGKGHGALRSGLKAVETTEVRKERLKTRLGVGHVALLPAQHIIISCFWYAGLVLKDLMRK
jgi:hypothetical protein